MDFAWLDRLGGIDGKTGNNQTGIKLTFPSNGEHGKTKIVLNNAVKDGILVVTRKMQCVKPPDKTENPSNSATDNVCKKGGISRYIANANGEIVIRVDNNDHGYPKAHNFKNGEHCHISALKDGKLIDLEQEDIPDVLRRLCSDILKGDNDV